MDFRTRLRDEIEYSGLLDKEVAALAGISKRAIDSYVGAQGCMPSADVAVRLARVLNTSVEYLVNGVREIDNTYGPEPYSKRLIKIIKTIKTIEYFSEQDLTAVEAIVTSIGEKYKK